MEPFTDIDEHIYTLDVRNKEAHKRKQCSNSPLCFLHDSDDY